MSMLTEIRDATDMTLAGISELLPRGSWAQ